MRAALRSHLPASLAIVSLAACGRGLALPGAPQDDPPSPPSGPAPVEEVAARCRPSVVLIRSSDRSGELGGVGSGFVVRSDGLIATNYHVIGEGRPFTVRLASGKTLEPIRIFAADREKDLAIIEVAATGLPALELGDADALRPGAPVFTVGNPLGFDLSVARGVVAEKRVLDGREMIQVAMPIEPGNSGSPLLDHGGRVVGVIAIKSADTIGFAVPSGELRALLERPRPVPIERWFRIGALSDRLWRVITSGGRWRQESGGIVASGEGDGFGGRMLCLSRRSLPEGRFELAVDVKLEDESGAAGLAFFADGGDRHYGFYPTHGALRLTRFEGPTVFQWTILETIANPRYRRGEWNTIKVRVDGARLECFVNDELVIEAEDTRLRGGSAGLCKFRSPTAEFRRFRIAADIPAESLDGAAVARVHELARELSPTGPPSAAAIEELARLGPGAVRALEERARDLEDEAFRLRHLSQRVHAHSTTEALVEVFATAGAPRPEAEVDLLRAALLLARLDNSEVDVASYVDFVDQLAADARARLEGLEPEERRLDGLIDFFVEELRFRGSTREYYHPSNAAIDEVLDDREGLPITLSVIFIELARRLDIPVAGLGVPRRFLVQYAPPGKARRIFDLFGGGRTVSLEEARALTGVALEESDLVPASKRSTIVRMLRNMANAAARREDLPALLRYYDAILALDEDAAYERWQRAVLRARTAQLAAAAEDLDRLLEKEPEGVDRREVLELRALLRREGY